MMRGKLSSFISHAFVRQPSILHKASVGLGSGIIQGMTGVGGGIVLTTAMTRMFATTQLQATGTSLAFKITGNISAAATFAGSGLVDYTSAFWIGMPAFIGVIRHQKNKDSVVSCYNL
mmetsp:Transcript_9217/g.14907  ORF Transcript_9217/g.14907 Transcript_9217/m.14907 type:complete len:118 (+) Transcript_9217:132-485(+)